MILPSNAEGRRTDWLSCGSYFLLRLCLFRNMKLKCEIFPAATDSRYIRAVSICVFPLFVSHLVTSLVTSLRSCLCYLTSPCILFAGRPPSNWFLSHEPHSCAAARPQWIPEWAGLSSWDWHLCPPHCSTCECCSSTSRSLSKGFKQEAAIWRKRTYKPKRERETNEKLFSFLLHYRILLGRCRP